MANPNRALANVPKRPFDWDSRHVSEFDADDRVAALKAEGWDAKKTRVQLQKAGKSKATGRWVSGRAAWNVWKRERDQ